MKDLDLKPVMQGLDLLAPRTAAAFENWSGATDVNEFVVAASDPAVADTDAFCERYDFPMEDSVNCVIIAGKRGETVSYSALMVLATTRADVNGVVRKLMGAKKASFAPMDDAVALSQMEFGGITPFGLPEEWPIYVDSRVIDVKQACVGSGIRASTLFVPGPAIAEIKTAEIIEGLAR